MSASETILMIIGGITTTIVVGYTIFEIQLRIRKGCRNPLCFWLGHSLKVGSKTARIYRDVYDHKSKTYIRKELLWTCTRKWCPVRIEKP